jgi:hypothetical protein
MQQTGRTSDAPVFFMHLGMSKTATTYLQADVFPKLPFLTFLDQPRTEILRGGRYQGLFARAFRRSPALWAEQGEALFAELFGASFDRRNARDVLISDQSAGPAMWETGPYAGDRWERERNDPFTLRAHLEAMREHALRFGFAEVRVLLLFRRQDEWIASKYAQRSDRILPASQQHFEERVAYYLDPARGYYKDGIVLDYSMLHEQLTQAVGHDKVLMLPYELLLNAPNTFFERLLDFLDAEERFPRDRLSDLMTTTERNVRSRSDRTWALRPRTMQDLPFSALLTHRFVKQLAQPLVNQAAHVFGTRREKVITLTPELRKRIIERYEDSNRQLDKTNKYDLKKYGYVNIP